MMKAEKMSHEEQSRSTTAVQGQSAGVYQKWRTLALGRHLHIVPHGGTKQDTGQSLCLKKFSRHHYHPDRHLDHQNFERKKTPTC